METKRLILAIALSIAVIMLYQYIFVKPVKPVPAAQTAQPVAAQAQPGTPQQTSAAGGDFDALMKTEEQPVAPVDATLPAVSEDRKGEADHDVIVETDLYRAVFTSRGAGLKSFVLKKYYDDKKSPDGKKNPLDLISDKVNRGPVQNPPLPFYFSTAGQEDAYKLLNREFFACSAPAVTTLQAGRKTVVRFEYSDKQLNLAAWKSFTLEAGSYVIGLDVGVTKNSRPLSDVPLLFGPDLENNISADRPFTMGLKISAWDGENRRGPTFSGIKTQKAATGIMEKGNGDVGGGFHWAAYETTYFAVIFKTDFARSRVAYQVLKNKGQKSETLYSYMVVTHPQAVFLGPKDEEVLAAISDRFADADEVIEYGWFGSLAKLMLKGLNLIHRIIPNYGWAIIVFTLFLKLLLFPLTYSSSVSMAKMQALQPKLKAIRKKYKNMKDLEQRREMNVEVMALYKQEKVNPAGGCLPMLLQLPILWGFFNMLRVSINIRHAPWIDFWISDLSVKDPIYLLPILMGVSMLIVQKMTPSTGDDMQKKLMYMMPILMIVMFLNFASGLNLYWAFSNVLQIGQQKLINKRIYQQRKDEEKERKLWKRKKGAIQS